MEMSGLNKSPTTFDSDKWESGTLFEYIKLKKWLNPISNSTVEVLA